MKNKILIGLSLIVGLAFASLSEAAVISTNVTTGGVFRLLNDRASVYSVIVSSDKACVVELFDQNSIVDPQWGTNYVSGLYLGRAQYATNYVTSYVGYNGFTNWYTNSGLWSYTITNAAATNALSPMGVFPVSANLAMVNTTDMLFVRGIVMRTSTNATVVINYRSGE